MTDLDKKLIEIVGAGQPTALAVADIVNDVKQAFIDAGWFIPADAEFVQQIINHRAQQKIDNAIHGVSVVEIGPAEKLTGPDWYAKLEDLAECNCESHINQVCDKCQVIQPFLKAARKLVV